MKKSIDLETAVTTSYC